MPLQNLLGDLNLEGTQQELLGGVILLLSSILEKMPRVDANDRLMVNTGDQGNVQVAYTNNSQVIGTVTTVADMTRLGAFGSAATARPADAMPIHMGNAGSMHIYNNLVFS